MKKVLILIAFITLPLLTVGQDKNSTDMVKNEVVTIDTTAVKTLVETAKEENIALSTAAKTQLNELSYKKSNELISINAYRKSLQIKVKTIRNC